MTFIEARVAGVGEEFVLGAQGIQKAEPGDVVLRLEDGGTNHTLLLAPEAARLLGMRLVSEGAAGMNRRYGAVGALKRILGGKSLTIPETEGSTRA